MQSEIWRWAVNPTKHTAALPVITFMLNRGIHCQTKRGQLYIVTMRPDRQHKKNLWMREAPGRTRGDQAEEGKQGLGVHM